MVNPMSNTAYCCLCMDGSTNPPTVNSVGIFSSSGIELTTVSPYFFVDVVSTPGKSYQEARDYLVDHLKHMAQYVQHYKWILDNLDRR